MANLILVGIDGSDSSMIAGRRAAELAVALKSKLFVFTSYDTSESGTVGVGSDKFTITSASVAEGTARRAAAELHSIAPSVEFGVEYGKPGNAIVTEAERLEADLIVLGNRNMQGLKRVLGSVPNMVSHNAPCDVYIVKTV